jgi:uncharacterized alkaline shock family protein YloU
VTTAGLTIERSVVEELVRLAALEVPGVARLGSSGPAWRQWLGGSPVRVAVTGGSLSVSVRIVARPGQQLLPLSASVRAAIAAAVERVPTLELRTVDILVDGVGA